MYNQNLKCKHVFCQRISLPPVLLEEDGRNWIRLAGDMFPINARSIVGVWVLITPISLFSLSLADLRESGNRSNAITWSFIQGVLLLSHYFLMTDSSANLELIEIEDIVVERTTVLWYYFFDHSFSIKLKLILRSIKCKGCMATIFNIFFYLKIKKELSNCS